MFKFLSAFLLLTFLIPADAGLPPTSSRISGESVDSTTFTTRFPNFTGTRTGTVLSLGTNSVAGGGTGATSLSDRGVLIGRGTSPVESVSSCTTDHILTCNSNGTANPSFKVNGTAVTNQYFSGYMVAQFNSSGTGSFADMSGSSNTLTTVFSNVLSVTAAASNVLGITLTPPTTTAAYDVTFSFFARNTTATQNCVFRLYDGTTVLSHGQLQLGTSSLDQMTLNTVWLPGTTSAVTLKLQAYAAANTCRIEAFATGSVSSIDYKVVQIRP